jgi:hypothetical protein
MGCHHGVLRGVMLESFGADSATQMLLPKSTRIALFGAEVRTLPGSTGRALSGCTPRNSASNPREAVFSLLVPPIRVHNTMPMFFPPPASVFTFAALPSQGVRSRSRHAWSSARATRGRPLAPHVVVRSRHMWSSARTSPLAPTHRVTNGDAIGW